MTFGHSFGQSLGNGPLFQPWLIQHLQTPMFENLSFTPVIPPNMTFPSKKSGLYRAAGAGKLVIGIKSPPPHSGTPRNIAIFVRGTGV